MTERAGTDTGRHIRFGRGYPDLVPDITRNLRQATARLAGQHAEARFTAGPALAGLHDEIRDAWQDRCAQAGREADPAWWAKTWRQASEAVTFRIDGELSAWLLAAPGTGYPVLAGQMTASERARRCRAGRAAEAIVLARAMCGPLPWPPLPALIQDLLAAVPVRLDGPGFARLDWLDWGPGHEHALLTRPRTPR